MTHLREIVREMIYAVKFYEKFVKEDIKDYREICSEAKDILIILGEEKITPDKENSIELKRFINSLKKMEGQLEESVLDKNLIRIAYRESLRQLPKVLSELISFYNYL